MNVSEEKEEENGDGVSHPARLLLGLFNRRVASMCSHNRCLQTVRRRSSLFDRRGQLDGQRNSRSNVCDAVGVLASLAWKERGRTAVGGRRCSVLCCQASQLFGRSATNEPYCCCCCRWYRCCCCCCTAAVFLALNTSGTSAVSVDLLKCII